MYLIYCEITIEVILKYINWKQSNVAWPTSFLMTITSYVTSVTNLLQKLSWTTVYSPSKENKEVDIPMDPGIFVLNNHASYKRQ